MLYYGNNAAAGLNSGPSTFSFFDDFESWIISASTGWTDIASQPTAIADQTAAVYNGKLYVIGGYTNGPNDPKNTNYEYNPATNTWITKAPMPTARWGMAAVEFNGLIYVFGGSSTSGAGNIAKNEVYNPVSGSWTTSADIPSGITQQGVMGVRLGDSIHLFCESYHYAYAPATDLYKRHADVPNPRFWCTSAVIGEKIYLIGGHHGGGAYNDNQEYDHTNHSWATKAPLPVSMWGATRDNPVIIGKIYVTHGHNGSTFFTTNYVYDPATDTWEQKGPASYPRDGVACGVISNKLYVVGGRADLVGPYGLAYGEVYDPVTDTWTPQPDPGSSLWSYDAAYASATGTAKYQGNYGLMIRQLTDEGTQRYAQSVAGFGAVYALDLDWQITDIGGIGTQPKPQGLITLTETDPTGSLYFYNAGNTPVVRWFNGSSFNHLENSTWNSWHKVTVVRNGSDSRVIFDGNMYQPPLITSPPSTGTGIFKIGVYFATTQYLDNVRVRQWAGSDPVAVVGAEQFQGSLWTGGLNQEWNNTGNWSSGVVPGSTINVAITNVGNDPVITGTANCNNLVIEPSASLVIEAGGALTISGGLTNNGGLTGGLTINSTSTSNSGSLIVNGSSIGNVTYNRFLRPEATFGDRHFFSSPVSGQTVAGFTAVNNSKIVQVGSVYQVWRYEETDGSWPIVSSGSLESGKGYNVDQETGSDGLLTFTGSVVNSASITATSPYKENYTDRSTPAAYGVGNQGADIWAPGRGWTSYGGGGWNLMGNPFTSAMNAATFVSVNSGKFDPNYQALYVYDGNSTTPQYKYAAAIVPYDPGYEEDGFYSDNIQAGQGFFVLALYNNLTFNFSPTMQVNNTGVTLLKSAIAEKPWPGLKLKVKYGNNESQTTIVYNSAMTTGLDPGYDVGQLSTNPDVEIYTTLAIKDNSVNFARQALPLTDFYKYIISVGIDSDNGGEVTFSAYAVPLENYKFWLEDRTTGIFTDLNTNTYTVTLPAKTYGTGRFFIIASIKTPAGRGKPQAEDTNLPIWTSNDKIIIKGEVSDRAICEIYDTGGRKVMLIHLTDGELNTVALPSGSLGVYLIRVTDGVKVTTKKVARL